MEKICPYCFKKFTPTFYSLRNGYKKRYSNAIYCSSSCMSKARFRRNHKYYENYWKKNAFKWQEKRKCVMCDNEFITKMPNQICCSIKCRRKKWKKAHWRQVLDYENALARSKSYKPELKNCQLCKKEFWTTKFNPLQKFCSVNCRVKAAYHNSRKTGRYWKNKANYRKNHKEQIKKHDEEYKARIRFGVTSKTFNKRIVIDRDKGICQVCRKSYQVIHHIKYSGKPEDLVLLCRSCHACIHAKIKQPPYSIS